MFYYKYQKKQKSEKYVIGILKISLVFGFESH